MVTFTDHRFSLKGLTFNANAATAFINPTVFSGLSVKYGADTCSDHPGPATMNGRVFIPEEYAAFYPTLNDTTSYQTGGPGGSAPVFRGRIDGLTIEDVDGFRAPTRINNSRAMTDLSPASVASRWNFYTNASDVPEVASNGTLGDGPNRVQAAPGTLVTTQPRSVRTVTPYAPVTAGQEYAFKTLAHAGFASAQVRFQWYTVNTGTGLISSDFAAVPYLGSENNKWFGVTTEAMTAPAGAKFVRISINLTPADSGPYSGSIALDTVALLAGAEMKDRPAGRWVTFQASDVTASAARLMVGGFPWPAEPADIRVGHLNELVPKEVFVFQTDPINTTELAYRDVDNQSSMAIFQRIAASIGAVAVASPNYETLITTGRPPRSPVSLEMIAGTPQIVDDPDLVKVPAGSIRKGPLSTSITGLSNTVKFGYRSWVEGGAEDASATIQNAESIAAYGPMARTIDTDLPAPSGKAWDQAQRMITAQSEPVYRLADSTQVVLPALPATAPSWDVFNAVEGFRRLVHIPDAPDLIGPYHRIRAAQMVFGAKPALTLDLEPANQIASDAVTFYDLTQPPYSGVPFSKFTHLTFDQLNTASKAAGW